jgi:hypothetical protein
MTEKSEEPAANVGNLEMVLQVQLLGQARVFRLGFWVRTGHTSAEKLQESIAGAQKSLNNSRSDPVDTIGGSTVAHLVRWFWKQLVVNCDLVTITGAEIAQQYQYHGPGVSPQKQNQIVLNG